MSAKPRSSFSSFEKQYLLELVTPYVNIVDCKKTKACFNQAKEKTWRKIAENFNSHPLCTETSHKQLKKAWQNMKCRMREAKELQQQQKNTEGGAHIPDMTPDDEAVLAVLSKVEVIKDSDGEYGSADSGDEDSFFWMSKKRRTQSPMSNDQKQELVEKDPLVATSTDRFKPTPEPIIEVQVGPTIVPKIKVEQSKTVSKPDRKQNLKAEALKFKIIENDLKTKRKQNEMELEHLRKSYEIKEKILLLELKYKERLLEMAEEEHSLKMKKF